MVRSSIPNRANFEKANSDTMSERRSIMHQLSPFTSITTVAAIALGTFVGIYFWRKRHGASVNSKSTLPRVVERIKKGPVTLEDSEAKYLLELIEKHNVSHDTRRFIFGLPSKGHIFGLPVGQHIYMSARVDDKLVVRPYTPISSDDDQGYVEFMIKVYFRDVHPLYAEGGKMSQHLDGLKIGDKMEFRGPEGLIVYKGNGFFEVRKNKKDAPVLRHFEEVGLIAGGTGITPILQIIRDVLKNPNDKTKLSLLFANQSEDDILLRQELEQLRDDNSDRFNLWFTVDRPPASGWDYSTGFINEQMISAHLPVAKPEGFEPKPNAHNCRSDKSAILICGPPPMVKFACKPSLEKLNFPENNYFVF